MRALRDYIAEQNQEVIVTAIRTLKEELDFDSTAINHLNLAIYLFQMAVNEVLRMHSIKPHWMFALDNLVRNAVQAAITVLSPGNVIICILSRIIFSRPSCALNSQVFLLLGILTYVYYAHVSVRYYRASSTRGDVL